MKASRDERSGRGGATPRLSPMARKKASFGHFPNACDRVEALRQVGSEELFSPYVGLEADRARVVGQDERTFDEIAVLSERLEHGVDAQSAEMLFAAEVAVVLARRVEQALRLEIEIRQHPLHFGGGRRLVADRDLLERDAVVFEPLLCFAARAAARIAVKLHRRRHMRPRPIWQPAPLGGSRRDLARAMDSCATFRGAGFGGGPAAERPVIPAFSHLHERRQLLESVVEFRSLPDTTLRAIAETMSASVYPALPRPWLGVSGRLPQDWYAPRLNPVQRWRTDGPWATAVGATKEAWVHPPAVGQQRPDALGLAVVGHGQIRLTQRWKGRTYEHTLGPGGLFGLQGYAARRAGAAFSELDPEAFDISAQALGRAVVLEISPADVDLLARDFPGLQDCLRTGFEAVRRAPAVVEILEQEPLLSQAAVDDLFALSAGLPLHRASDGETVAGGDADSASSHFVVVTAGDVSVLEPSGRRRIRQDRVIGLRSALEGRPLESEFSAVGRVEFVRVPTTRMHDLRRTRLPFERAIRSGLANAPAPPRRPSKNLDEPDVVLVAGPRSIAPHAGVLSDLVGEAAAAHLYDRTCVLHVIEGPSDLDELSWSPRPVDPRYPHASTKLRHRWLAVSTDPATARAQVDEQTRRILDENDADDGRPAFDVIVIDPSGLAEGVRVEMAGLACLTAIGYLLADPGAEIPRGIRDRSVAVVPIGLIEAARPLPPPGAGAAGALRSETSRADASPLKAGGLGRTAMVLSVPDLGPEAPASAGRLQAVRYVGRQVARGAREFAAQLAEPYRVGDATWDRKTPWPPRTVRIRMGAEIRTALAAEGAEAAVSGVQRPIRSLFGGPKDEPRVKTIGPDRPWSEAVCRLARGLTGRRVGVALGGGGAFGFVHEALLAALQDADAGVPIDLLSGSGTGTIVATYFAAGDTGFKRLRSIPGMLQAAMWTGPITTATIGVAIDFTLGTVDLNDLEVTLLPTVTDADTGEEATIRKGSVGHAVRASGSLPLFAPTVQGRRRYLDGGVVANVPVQVLEDEGAGLIIASNPIPEPVSLAPTLPAPIPGVGPLLKMIDPVTRISDSFRSTLTLMRAASATQEAFAHVRYRAEGRRARAKRSVELRRAGSLFDFEARESIIRDAAQGPEQRLEVAVQEATDAWHSLLRHAPARVWLADGPPAMIRTPKIVLREIGGHLHVVSTGVLREVAELIRSGPQIRTVTVRVDRSAIGGDGLGSARAAQAAAARIRTLLVDYGVSGSRVVLGAPGGPPAFAQAVEFRVSLDEPVTADRFDDVRARLIEGAYQALRRQEPDPSRARLLALEAAHLRLDDPSVLELFRAILETPIRRLGHWRAPWGDGRCAYDPGGQGLAIANVVPQTVDVVSETSKIQLSLPNRAGRVVDLQWSADGHLAAAYAGPDPMVAVWSMAHPEPLRLFAPGARSVTALPNGWVVVDDEGASLWLNDRPSTRIEHPRAVAVHVSPDGHGLVTLGRDRRVGLWTLDGRLKNWLVSGQPGDTLAAWGPRGRLAVAVGRRVWLWRDPQQEPRLLTTHRRAVVGLAWSHDGAMLATAALDGRLCLWQAEPAQLKDILRPPPFDASVALAFHPLRRSLAMAASGALSVWSADTGLTEVQCLDAQAAPRAGDPVRLSWHPAGVRLATAGASVREVGLKENVALDHDGEPVDWAAWAPGAVDDDDAGAWAAFATDGGEVCVWNPQTRALRRRLMGPTGHRTVAAWHPSGRWLALARGRRLSLFDLRSGARYTSLALDGACRQMHWTAAGALVIRLSNGWLVANLDGDRLKIQHRAEALLTGLDVDPIGGRVCLRRRAGGATIARIERRGVRTITTVHATEITSASWSAQGELALVSDGTLSIWREPVGLAPQPVDGPIVEAKFRPRARAQLAVVADALLSIVELDGEPRRLEAFAPVTTVEWSPDGRFLASGEVGGLVRLWRADDRASLGTIDHHTGSAIRGLAWRPDGERLMSWSADGGLRVSLVRPHDLLMAVGRFASDRRLDPGTWARWMKWTGRPPADTWPRSPDAEDSAT